jgi:anti-sigma-K factor RskA
MICPKCSTPIDEETVFCGNCGTQVAPLYARGATVVEATEKMSSDKGRSDPYQGEFRSQRSFPPVSMPQASFSPPPRNFEQVDSSQVPTVFTPTPTFAQEKPRHLNVRRAVFLGLILLVLAGGMTAGVAMLLKGRAQPAPAQTAGNVAAAPGVTGLVSISDSANAHSGALKISIIGLNAPPSGSQYNAWLVDEATEHAVTLGVLTPQPKGFALTFSGNTNVLSQGNVVEITQEQGNVQLPTGKVVLTGMWPAQAFVHIRHLLLAFPNTPGNVGLLVGLRDQARLLNAQATQLKQVVNSGNQGAVRSEAQGMLDVIEGKNGQNAHPLAGFVPFPNITDIGDGYGLLGNGGYVNMAAAHASLAATRSDATQTIKLHAGHVIIAMNNIKGWLTTIDHDVFEMVNNPGNTSKLQEIITLCDHSLNGVDLDGDESIDPVPGEAGAIVGYNHGQLMAGLTLHP